MFDFRKTLFICTGNIFRSIIAEKLFIQNALKRGLSWQVRSRGTNSYFKTPHPLLNQIVEKGYSITLKGHRAQKLSIEDIDWASIIICFTPDHQQTVIQMFPYVKNKTFLISDIASPDPSLFQDIDYHDVSETNEHLLKTLRALKSAVDEITKSTSLSMVMAVYNEDKNIKNILTKLTAQSSLHEVKEIVVISSGSTDKTDKIIQSMKSPLITLLQEKVRNGKVSALKKVISFIKGNNVLLIDGDVDIDANFIKECFFCIHNGTIPCTGKIIPIPAKSRFFYELSVVGCMAWNALREKKNMAHNFLYPSGYAMMLSRSDFIDGIKQLSNTTINDDGLLSLVLFQKGILFRYCDDLRVYVKFPQSFQDFFRQKVRTRMGRRQTNSYFFKKIEKQWRSELFGMINKHNFIFVIALLIMDSFARFIAGIKIKFSRDPHLWESTTTTKEVQTIPLASFTED